MTYAFGGRHSIQLSYGCVGSAFNPTPSFGPSKTLEVCRRTYVFAENTGLPTAACARPPGFATICFRSASGNF